MVVSASLAVGIPAVSSPWASALSVTAPVPARTEVAVFDGATGSWSGSNATRPGPSLSLAKLYLGYAVIAAGDPADAAKVPHMIATSDDAVASSLDATYPGAIDWTITRFGLTGTTAGPTWGWGSTTMSDVAYFVQAIRDDPVGQPILEGMRAATPVAADGYRQNYGTSTIDGVWATKFGWDDDGLINATVSVGRDFVVAARTTGPADQLTADLSGLGARPGHNFNRANTADPVFDPAAATGRIPDPDHSAGHADAVYRPGDAVPLHIVTDRIACAAGGSSAALSSGLSSAISASVTVPGWLATMVAACPRPTVSHATTAVTDADRAAIRTDPPGSLRRAPLTEQPWYLRRHGLPVPR